MTIVKICGLTSIADARAAVVAGADLLGLNFHPPSPRHLELETAIGIATALRTEFNFSCPPLVGIFVSQEVEEIQYIMSQVPLDAAQLSGDFPDERLKSLSPRAFVSIRPRSPEEALQLTRRYRQSRDGSDRLPAILVDSFHPRLYGGSGQLMSRDIAAAALDESAQVMLAGGLTAENVREQLRGLLPWGVDTASGVESAPGRKDAAKMRDFITASHASRTKE